VSHILVGDADGVRTITFDRPEVKNALTAAMRRELCELVDAADRDPSVRAIVITGTDPVFTAGVDFKEKLAASDARQRRFTVNPGSALRAIRTPTVCAVNGACVSGGLEIALSATFVVASERARFADTHARLNVVPAWGLTALLPRAVGLRKARELSLTGDFVDAHEALRIGLVNHVVPHDELLPFTTALVGRFADTLAAASVLDIYDQGTDLGLSAALALETARVADGPAWDAERFTVAGRATAARQRKPNGSPPAH
jgi:enoyl-CoA hydratase/carnithine racemase